MSAYGAGGLSAYAAGIALTPRIVAACRRRDGAAAMSLANEMIDGHGSQMGTFTVALSLAKAITHWSGLDALPPPPPGSPPVAADLPGGSPMFGEDGYEDRRVLALDFVERSLRSLDDQSMAEIKHGRIDGVALIQGLCELTCAVFAARPAVP